MIKLLATFITKMSFADFSEEIKKCFDQNENDRTKLTTIWDITFKRLSEDIRSAYNLNVKSKCKQTTADTNLRRQWGEVKGETPGFLARYVLVGYFNFTFSIDDVILQSLVCNL